jgi:hypothetical protein
VGLKAVGIVLGNRKVARGKQPIIIQQKYKATAMLASLRSRSRSTICADICKFQVLMTFLFRMNSMTAWRPIPQAMAVTQVCRRLQKLSIE